jgi:cyclohexa-1,5-dienecarbonyl-CoA hydratase
VVLRSAGEKAFSAGVAVEDHSAPRATAMLEGFHGAIRTLWDLAPVTLAVVRGHCLGGGMELATACDLLLAADDSRFGQPEIDLGCYPPLAAAAYPRLIGEKRTFELLLTGRVVDCAEAEALGLVSWSVPAAELESRLSEVTAQLLAKSAPVARALKAAIVAGRGSSFPVALAESERLYLDELIHTEDMTEGIEAFLAKRRPVWKHR